MANYFTFKGVSTASVGITVLTQPEITIAQERAEFIDIPGRSGSLTVLEGDDVYGDITLTAECYISDASYAAAAAKFFKGSGALVLPGRSGGYYEARITSQIPLERILRGRTPRKFAVTFRCKPFFRLTAGETEQAVTSGYILNNTTGFISKPLIKLTCTGDITLMVGTQIVYLDDITTGIWLDCETQEAYLGSTLKNNSMRGEFPVLVSGQNAISWTGNVTECKVTPRWVTL